MSGYLELAETALFKNGRLTLINTYSDLSTIAMPAEFRFDMAVMCGPKWSVGEHKLVIKVRANENAEELTLSEATINIPHENFVYHAVGNDIKFTMNYDVKYLTFTAYDNDEEVISRVYPVRAMLVPRSMAEGVNQEDNTQVVTELTEADLENSEIATQEEQQENVTE